MFILPFKRTPSNIRVFVKKTIERPLKLNGKITFRRKNTSRSLFEHLFIRPYPVTLLLEQKEGLSFKFTFVQKVDLLLLCWILNAFEKSFVRQKQFVFISFQISFWAFVLQLN